MSQTAEGNTVVLQCQHLTVLSSQMDNPPASNHAEAYDAPVG